MLKLNLSKRRGEGGFLRKPLLGNLLTVVVVREVWMWGIILSMAAMMVFEFAEDSWDVALASVVPLVRALLRVSMAPTT